MRRRSVHTIIIGEEMQGEVRNYRNKAYDFLRACPNVRSLSVHDFFGWWSSAFGAQLETLEIASSKRSAVIPKSCPSFLKLNYNSASNYVSMDIRCIDWSNVGSRLESLIISVYSFPEDVLKRIRRNCKNQKHIGMRAKGPEEGSIAKIIQSYGDQLDLIHVHDMPENELTQIAETCGNARFDAYAYRENVLPTLRILGARLESIRFSLHKDRCSTGEFASSWSLCSSLKRLDAMDCRFDEIRAILGN